MHPTVNSRKEGRFLFPLQLWGGCTELKKGPLLDRSPRGGAVYTFHSLFFCGHNLLLFLLYVLLVDLLI